MKISCSCLTKSGHCFYLCIVVLLLSLSDSVYGQMYPDDELYRIGYEYHIRSMYPQAAMYLFAYIQRNPERVQREPNFAQQLMIAWQFSITEAEKAIKERDELKARLGSQGSGLEKTSSGINPPPPLPTPKVGKGPPQVKRQDIEQSYLKAQLGCWQNHSTDMQAEARWKCLQQAKETYEAWLRQLQ